MWSNWSIKSLRLLVLVFWDVLWSSLFPLWMDYGTIYLLRSIVCCGWAGFRCLWAGFEICHIILSLLLGSRFGPSLLGCLLWCWRVYGVLFSPSFLHGGWYGVFCHQRKTSNFLTYKTTLWTIGLTMSLKEMIHDVMYPYV